MSETLEAATPAAGGPGRHPEGPLLDLDQVSVGFGGLLALDDVSMSVNPGEIVGVIGPNGAGKTTLFNIISGFVHPDRGSVAYRGKTLHKHRPHDLARLGIARTLQGVGLCAGLTVLENVMLGAEPVLHSDIVSSFLGLWRSSREERRVALRAREILTELGAGSVVDQYPRSLPYGMQKRTALARALMADPRLVMLDEPASGLSETDMGSLGTLLRGAHVADVGSPGRAPHGPCDVRLRPDRGSQLRTGDRRGHTGSDPLRRGRGHGLSRRRGSHEARRASRPC